MVKALIEENATTALEQDNYRIKYNQLERRYQEVQDKLNKLVNEKERKVTQRIAINNFMESYQELPEILTSWSDDIFILMVDTVIVDSDGTMKFLFKSGDRVKV